MKTWIPGEIGDVYRLANNINTAAVARVRITCLFYNACEGFSAASLIYTNGFTFSRAEHFQFSFLLSLSLSFSLSNSLASQYSESCSDCVLYLLCVLRQSRAQLKNFCLLCLNNSFYFVSDLVVPYLSAAPLIGCVFCFNANCICSPSAKWQNIVICTIITQFIFDAFATIHHRLHRQYFKSACKMKWDYLRFTFIRLSDIMAE